MQTLKKRKSFEEKLFDFIFKTCTSIVIKLFRNLIQIPKILTGKEKYLLIVNLTVTFAIIIFNKWYLNYYSFILVLNYFILRAIYQEIKETYFKNKYKDLSKIFNDKVKIVEYNKKDESYKIHSYLPISDLEKKREVFEHYLNKSIFKIKRNDKNFRMMTIYTESLKKNVLLRKNYFLDEWILKVERDKSEIFFIIGINEKGKIIKLDLIKTSNIFIAGMQGGGKSNILNVIIQTLMYFNQNVYYIMIDFKEVELSQYEDFPNTKFIENNKNNALIETLEKLEIEMDNRYSLIRKAKLKKISQYNKKNQNKMAYIVLIIDEFSEVKLGLKDDKEVEKVEKILTRILNKGRAAGIIGIFTTQRPSAKQISTEIRDRFYSVLSALIKKKETQRMVGISGTENLKNGEFLMEIIEDVTKLKAFYIDEVKRNGVYNHLQEQYKGVIDNDISLFLQEKKDKE